MADVTTMKGKATAAGGGAPRALSPVRAYLAMARVDHWLKNALMLLGILLALFYEPSLFTVRSLVPLGIAIAATCLVASSNYVLNELLDARSDRFHPDKRQRPAAVGAVTPWIGYVEWLALALAGFGLAMTVNRYVAAAAAALWVMGLAYNVPPVRMKEWPYLDVLAESINNPIRLLLGWFPLITDRFPSVSLILSYWMAGAFLMATKRLAEYRHIGDPAQAALYRRSFRHYTEERLLVSILFYTTACALVGGIFILRYHLELILFVPVAAGLFAYYFKLGLLPDSPAQHPERLWRQRGFLAYLVVCLALFTALMFSRIPVMYRLFNVEPSRTNPLWIIGAPSPGSPEGGDF